MLKNIKHFLKDIASKEIIGITEKFGMNNRACQKNNKTFLIDKKLIQISIFKDDDIYKDPLEVHNESIKKTNYLNNSKIDEYVYNRSNVGMNVILINNSYLNIKTINKLYKELRDSEINHTKRFVFLTSLFNNIFNYGFNLNDFLKIIEIYQKTKNKKYLEIFKKILININDLAYLIFSYRKPLISYCNGKVKGSGGFLSFLSNYSASYFHSSYCYNNLSYSLLPYGGISYVLANLRGSLGFYLALTGESVYASDLIWSGLTKRWISHQALELLEITSESQLEVSEQDARILLEEHFLHIPKVYSLKGYEEIIHDHFKYDNLHSILKKLKNTINKKGIGANDKEKKWAQKTYDQICSFPPLATHLTFEILNILRKYKMELLNKCQINKNTWQKILRNSYKVSKTKEEVSMEELKYTIDKTLFIKSLNLETNTFLNFILNPDVLTGIASYLVKDSEHSFKATYLNNITDVKKDILLYFLYYKNNYEYQIYHRPDISFSSLPVLEKFNQYYDYQSGISYDRFFFDKQRKQWDDNYLKEELEEISKNLT